MLGFYLTVGHIKCNTYFLIFPTELIPKTDLKKAKIIIVAVASMHNDRALVYSYIFNGINNYICAFPLMKKKSSFFCWDAVSLLVRYLSCTKSICYTLLLCVNKLSLSLAVCVFSLKCNGTNDLIFSMFLERELFVILLYVYSVFEADIWSRNSVAELFVSARYELVKTV